MIAFIRIRSPSNAPPVFLLEGSTDINPIVFLGKSIKKRLTNSSTNDDFPAPPVPVIPRTGILEFSFFLWISCKVSFAIAGKFSAADIILAIAPASFFSKRLTSSVNKSPIGKSDFSTKSLIIPCKPNFLPSSGE